MHHCQGLVAYYPGRMPWTSRIFGEEDDTRMHGASVAIAGFHDTFPGDIDGEGGLLGRPPIPCPSSRDHSKAVNGRSSSVQVFALDHFGGGLISNEQGFEMRFPVLAGEEP